jgi:hypothetical protein
MVASVMWKRFTRKAARFRSDDGQTFPNPVREGLPTIREGMRVYRELRITEWKRDRICNTGRLCPGYVDSLAK